MRKILFSIVMMLCITAAASAQDVRVISSYTYGGLQELDKNFNVVGSYSRNGTIMFLNIEGDPYFNLSVNGEVVYDALILDMQEKILNKNERAAIYNCIYNLPGKTVGMDVIESYDNRLDRNVPAFFIVSLRDLDTGNTLLAHRYSNIKK